MTTQHGQEYNQFIQSLEEKTTTGGFFYNHIDNFVYITDYDNKLLGIWDKREKKPSTSGV